MIDVLDMIAASLLAAVVIHQVRYVEAQKELRATRIAAANAPLSRLPFMPNAREVLT